MSNQGQPIQQESVDTVGTDSEKPVLTRRDDYFIIAIIFS